MTEKCIAIGVVKVCGFRFVKVGRAWGSRTFLFWPQHIAISGSLFIRGRYAPWFSERGTNDHITDRTYGREVFRISNMHASLCMELI
jgi:hypothetical protein